MFRRYPKFITNCPRWIISAFRYIKQKQLFLVVPLAGLTISNYAKDYTINEYQKESKELSSSISVLMSNQVSRAGIIEQTDLIFWVKELINDEYKIIYISPEYDVFLPEGMSRFDLLGRTGRYLDEEFGDIYQKNDVKAAKLKHPEIFKEPYKKQGVGNIVIGDFLKGRLKNTGSRILVFGLYVNDSKKQVK